MILTPRHLVEPLEPSLRKFEEEGAWRMLNRKLVSEYFKNEEALLYSFQKS